jgi:hypothetical protein
MTTYWVIGPFLTIITVLLYLLYHLEHFSWGKTRQVILDDEPIKNSGVFVSSGASGLKLESIVETPPQRSNYYK